MFKINLGFRIAKNSLFFSFFIFHFIISLAQVERPATWKVSYSKSEVVLNSEVDIIFEVDIKKGWYMYSVGKFEMAPAANFTFVPDALYELVGATKAIHDKEKNDEYIGKYRYFTEKATFVQTIKILSKNPKVKGTYEFSTCSSENGICLPPRDEEFELGKIEVLPAKIEKANQTKAVTPQKNNQKLNKAIIADSENEAVFKTKRDSAAVAQTTITSEKDTISTSLVTKAIAPVAPAISLWGFFILAFLSGLVALVTPCVFPMIPMTVSFFLHSSRSKADGILKAVLYGLSIIGIYTIIGTAVARFSGAETANFLSTHWIPNLFFFGVFILFSLSFLGMFEIVLPSWLVNSVDKQSDRGGYSGIFFMAFTIVLVSFSCTGPIVGSILVESAGGAFLKPMVGMFGFSLAFALPFTLFAIFPNWLKNLPKSGGWLNTVKVSLGFLELALAFKFFSLADQAYHWGILSRDINIAIWIVVFVFLGLYLLHKIKTPHDDKDYLTQAVSVPKIILSIMSFAFAIYLLPGLIGAPLKPLSGYLPPVSTLDFNLTNLKGESALVSKGNTCETPKYSDFLELPHGIQGYFDYKQALACAQKLNRPLFIDFTGHGCVNCREMEARVWSNPEVLQKLKNDFVVVALYVDDKKELPESEWVTSSYDGKVKKSIGKQNADFQIARFNTNAQPYYVILDPAERPLSGPITYDLDPAHFIDFLNKGVIK